MLKNDRYTTLTAQLEPSPRLHRYCNRHHRYNCRCGRKCNDYTALDEQIVSVLRTSAGGRVPVSTIYVQARLSAFYDIFRSERQLRRDLNRLVQKQCVVRQGERGGWYLRQEVR